MFGLFEQAQKYKEKGRWLFYFTEDDDLEEDYGEEQEETEEDEEETETTGIIEEEEEEEGGRMATYGHLQVFISTKPSPVSCNCSPHPTPIRK